MPLTTLIQISMELWGAVFCLIIASLFLFLKPKASRREYFILALGMDGVITYVNPAAVQILDRKPGELLGQRFARCFFEHPENDVFNQAILDAIYDAAVSHENVVPYYTDRQTRQFHVTTSYLRDGQETIGVIAVFRDISELPRSWAAQAVAGCCVLRQNRRILHAGEGIIRKLTDTGVRERTLWYSFPGYG